MKRTFAKLFYLVSASLAVVLLAAPASKAQKLLRHVVLLKFKEGTTMEEEKTIEEAFRKLPSQISLVKSYEWGMNNSPEKLNEGLTVCFFLTFASEKDRDDYLVHPAHKAFVALLTPHLDKPVVVDYWAMQ